MKLNKSKIFISAIIMIIANLVLFKKLSEQFGYMGYDYYEKSIFSYLTVFIYCLIPLIVFKLKNNSQIIFFTLYYSLLYLPIIVSYHMLTSYFEFISYSSVFLLGFLLTLWLHEVKFYRSSRVGLKLIKNKYQFKILQISLRFSAFFLIYLFIFNFGNFSFVSLEDIYFKRSALIFDKFSGYSTLLLTYFFAPLILSIGLIRKKYSLIIIGISLSILMFGFTGGKIALFSPIIILVFSKIISISNKEHDIFYYLTNMFSFIIFSLVYLYEYFGLFSSIILQRTFGNSGLLTYQYMTFFETNPNTYLSHNSLFKYFYDYPYKKDLGMVVYDYFYFTDTDGNSNSNANFLATDGIASFDIFGVLFISLIVGLYLNVTKYQLRNDPEIYTFMLVPFCMLLTNISFFTILLSGGWIFFNIYLLKRI